MTYIYRTDDNETDEIIYFAVSADDELQAKRLCLDCLLGLFREHNPFVYNEDDLPKTDEQKVIASVLAIYNATKPALAPYIEYTEEKGILTPTERFAVAENLFILDSTIPDAYVGALIVLEPFWLRYEPDSDHIKVVSQWVAGLLREAAIND